MVDCGFRLDWIPKETIDVAVYVNCDLVSGPYYGDGGLAPEPQSWTIDYSMEPVRVVFGAALCEQLQPQAVPVYVYLSCNCIN